MPESALNVSAASDAAAARRVFRVSINAPVDAVWREITRTDAPILCFFNSQMHLSRQGLVPGSKLAMRSPDARNTGVVGTILEVDPPRRFSHTFRFTNFNDPECIVIYELRPEGAGTEFTLTIENLPVGTRTAKQMVQGSSMITSTLKSVLEHGKPGLGIRFLFTLMKLFPVPKACRSEHWPV
ncbi:MAG: SRPBCC domain-containing protein [Phycisphaerales bacterium]